MWEFSSEYTMFAASHPGQGFLLRAMDPLGLWVKICISTLNGKKLHVYFLLNSDWNLAFHLI